jgi:tRNA (guanine37-N1)-methyltransferase
VKIKFVNLRDSAVDKHKTVDDTPYGGGSGMVIKVDIMDRAIQSIVEKKRSDYHIILLSPQGRRYDQSRAEMLLGHEKLILICGHYEGFDERIREHLIDEQISIGDFVISGGEIAAMAVADSIVRLLPGALGKDQSSEEESFSIKDKAGQRLLEYPQYTKPSEYEGWRVPEILISGDHAKIKTWRLEQAEKRSKKLKKWPAR